MARELVQLSLESLKTHEGLVHLNNMIQALYDNIAGDMDTVRVFNGYGSPENSISAGIGSLYLRLDGGTGTTVYIKESGTGDTGWVAIAKLTTPVSLANGGTGQDFSTLNQGDIIYDNGSNLARLTPGTSGQFLKTQGANANPVWANIGLLFKSVTSFSTDNSGDITIEASKIYKIIAYFDTPAADETIGMRFNSDSGANYNWIEHGVHTPGTNTFFTDGSSNDINFPIGKLDGTTAQDRNMTVELLLNTFAEGNNRIRILGQIQTFGLGERFEYSNFTGWWQKNVAPTSFEFYTTGTNNVNGKIYLYEYSLS